MLNAATMGVPQKRERAFIIGHKTEYNLPKLVLDFKEKPVFFKEVIDKHDMTCNLTDFEKDQWDKKRPKDRTMADTSLRTRGTNSGFTRSWLHSNDVCPTLTTTENIVYDFPRKLNEKEIKCCSSFPQDYKSPTREKLLWMCGMSVPPVMTAQVAYQIYKQWLTKIK